MGTVSGQVTDHAGAGVAGVWVYAYPADGGRFGRNVGMHTDLAGRYSFHLPPGRWMVRETGRGGREVTVTDEPEPAEPPSFAVGDVVRRRSSRHIGTVIGIDEHRLVVEFERPDGDPFAAEIPLARAGEALESAGETDGR